MAQARGANAKLRGAFETVWGTAPAATGYFDLPFKSANLGAGQSLESDPLLGQGRDPTDPYLGDIDVSGQIVVPVDLRNIGMWLKGAFGAPTTPTPDEGDPYVHTFSSGGASLPSLSLELGLPDLGKYFMQKGIRVGQIQIPFLTSQGFPDATIQVTGKDEGAATSSTGAGTPTTLERQRFVRFQGSMKKDDTALASITAAQVTYNNNLDAVRYLAGGSTLGDLDPAQAALTGSITARFKDTTLLDAATAGTPIKLSFLYAIDDDSSLVLNAYRCFLSRPKKNIQGPAGIEMQFDFQASYDDTATKMCDVVLTNDVEAY